MYDYFIKLLIILKTDNEDVFYFVKTIIDSSNDYKLIPLFNNSGINIDNLRANIKTGIVNVPEGNLTKKVLRVSDLLGELSVLSSGNY